MVRPKTLEAPDTTATQPSDPKPPPPKLMILTYASVSAASIVFVIATLIHLFSCGCRC